MLSASNISNAPGWLDLVSPDMAASVSFYQAVFGWTAAHESDDPSVECLMLRNNGEAVAGLDPLTESGGRPAWTFYVRVADAEAAAKTAEKYGGTVRVPLTDITPEAWIAQLIDPNGARFALWQPVALTGFEQVRQPGSLMWIELATRHPEIAKRFYDEAFGWKVQPVTTNEGRSERFTLSPDTDQGAFGGIAPISPSDPIQDETWTPYIRVEDVDVTTAEAVRQGGSVVVPAADTPLGRRGVIADQFGARLGLIATDR